MENLEFDVLISLLKYLGVSSYPRLHSGPSTKGFRYAAEDIGHGLQSNFFLAYPDD
jgi:hypothetical protein